MSAPVCSAFCPFLACSACSWQGGDTRAVQGEIPGLTWENGGTTKAAPAGNRGLTTTSDLRSL